MRFHSLNRLFFRFCSNCSIVTPSAPAAPPFLFTFNHASHTSCLGMSCDLPCNFGSLMRLLPFRLITLMHQDGPTPSLPNPLRYAGGSQLLRASPPALPHRYSAPHGFRRLGFSLSRPRTTHARMRTPLYRYAPSQVPDESLDRAHAACMPDTTWAVSGYLPDFSRSRGPTPVLMPSDLVSTRQRQRTHR